MLNPKVETTVVDGMLVAEFWDCLRLVPGPIQDLSAKYDSHVQAKGRPELIVDFLGVGIAGSAALGHFVRLQKTVRQRGGRIVFCNIDPHVQEAFRVSKLETLFTFVADRDAALVFFKPDPGANGSSVPPAS